ncbi:MAG: hypothetical protein FWH20_05470 [Oscillospiraceae bacterium]|nr:hypothetical protein [Oscillospiraceae bacterium]
MYKKLFILLLLLLIISGCTDISNVGLTEPPKISETSETSEASQVSEVSETPPTTDSPETSEPEIYRTHTFYLKDEKFLETCLFIGDSVMKGLADSGFLQSERVFADDTATPANIADLRFPILPIQNDGGEIGVLTALVNENPDNIFMQFGRGDTANSERTQFTEDYLTFLTLVNTYRPDSVITVLSIPPVSIETAALNNTTIEDYNAALKAMVENLRSDNIRFLDLDTELKNPQGKLKRLYAQPDGASLTQAGNHAVLWVICNS